MLSKLLPTLRSAFVCILSLLATASLAQTTIHVGPGQTYTTIQSGIDAANTGDTVLVAPGIYPGIVDFMFGWAPLKSRSNWFASICVST